MRPTFPSAILRFSQNADPFTPHVQIKVLVLISVPSFKVNPFSSALTINELILISTPFFRRYFSAFKRGFAGSIGSILLSPSTQISDISSCSMPYSSHRRGIHSTNSPNISIPVKPAPAVTKVIISDRFWRSFSRDASSIVARICSRKIIASLRLQRVKEFSLIPGILKSVGSPPVLISK